MERIAQDIFECRIEERKQDKQRRAEISPALIIRVEEFGKVKRRNLKGVQFAFFFPNRQTGFLRG